jgi:L-asparaginase
MRHVTLITCGGTIEKTYDETTGSLENRRSIVRRMLSRLRLEDTAVNVIELMSKDSLVMTDEDRRRVAEAVRAAGGMTDVLAACGPQGPAVPIVLTGAMRPYEMKRSDALQNLTEAIFATGVLPPGVYAVAHGRALKFPGVVKDRERGTFVATRS